MLRAQLTPAMASGPLSAMISLNRFTTSLSASSKEASLNRPFSLIKGIGMVADHGFGYPRGQDAQEFSG